MAEIELERRADGVAMLTLNAPERRNALTVEMAEALTAACEEIDADEAVGAVVVRGEGAYFCAGGDRATLAEAGRDPAEDERYRGMSAIYRSFARGRRARAADDRGDPRRRRRRRAQPRAGDRPARGRRGRGAALAASSRSACTRAAATPRLLGRLGSREAAAALTLFGERLTGAEAVERGLAWAAVPAGRGRRRRARARRRPGRRTRSWHAGPPRACAPSPARRRCPWSAALELERASQMWSMRRKAG